MPGGRVFSAGVVPNMNNNNILLQSQTARATSEPLFLPAPAPPFLGSRSMVSFEDVRGGKGFNGSFFRAYDPDENCDDGMDDYFHQPEKKRRLSADQVQFLEKSFEEDNKLEPERKAKLAKDLGLQPRQVAIWFQNRRARWKTKQLEKDYESLQASFDSLKANYDNLLKEKDRLKAEVANLTEKVVMREKQGGNDHLKLQAESTDTNGLQEPSSSSEPQKPPPLVVDSVSSEGEGSKVSVVGAAWNKHEEISSVKRDVLDSESPHYTDGVHSSSAPQQLEAGDSSYVFEPDQSDLSQDEEDNLISRSLLHPYIFPKLEDVEYSDPPETSCNFGFPEEDHHAAFWPWSY